MKTTKLAAVLFSKIADFDMLLNEDNHRALRLLEIYKNLLEGILVEHDGECMDKTGEEYLVIFNSAVNAVQFAMHFELAVMTYNKGVSDDREKFQICIGIHLGEIWQEEGHVYGNGVNIAARVMQAAEPGLILVSEDVERQVANKLDINFTEYEHAKLKNIARDLRVFRLGGAPSARQDPPLSTGFTGAIDTARVSGFNEAAKASGATVAEPPNKPEAPLSGSEINPLAYISEYFNSGQHDGHTSSKLPGDFRKHIRETIRNTVAEAVRKSIQAAELAENNPGASVVINELGQFIHREDTGGDLDITLDNGMSKLEKQLSQVAKKVENVEGLFEYTTKARPKKQNLEDMRQEAKAQISEGIIKCIAALALGAASVFAYIKLGSVWWLVGGVVVGLFPALGAIKKIHLGAQKYQKSKKEGKGRLSRGSQRKR